MSIPWLEKLSKRIHKTMKTIPTIPEFLNTEHKWNQITENTDTIENFENILYKVLNDDNISTLDAFKIMKQLEKDTIKQHMHEDIRTVLDVVAAISKYIYVASKELELKYKTEKLSKKIHKTMKTIPTIPEFLNTENKWNQITENTDTIENFENILYKVLNDDIISILDAFKIMKQLEKDTIKQHMHEDIRTVLDVVAAISKYIYVASKELELKYKTEKIVDYLTEKQGELTKDAEELVQYILQNEDEDY